MDRLLLAGGLTLVVIGAAILLRRLRPPTTVAASGPEGWALPQTLDRADFAAAAPWLLVVFTSATCDTCRAVLQNVQGLARPEIALVEVEYGADRALHQKYGIEGVPAVALVDAAGGVRHWVLGPVALPTLSAAVDEIVGTGQVMTIRPPERGDPG